MKISRTMLTIEGEGSIIKIDTVEHEKLLWLVPEWIEYPIEKVMRPTRMILLLPLLPEALENFGDVQWVVSTPVPKFLFEGDVPDELAGVYTVLVEPGISFPIPPVFH